MPDGPVIKQDDGRINERILAKEAKIDYLAKVEAARRKIPATFSSPEMKRLFWRCFDSMQLNMHFVSVIARTRLPHEMVEKVELSVTEQLERVTEEVNKAIDGAAALFQANGISSQAEYDALPMEITVRVVSKYGRRYLELLTTADQLMPMLETLAIDDVILTTPVSSTDAHSDAGAGGNGEISAPVASPKPARKRKVPESSQAPVVEAASGHA